MKVVLSLFLGMSAAASAKRSRTGEVDIVSDSELGKRILSKARRVNDANSYISYYQNGQQAGYYNGNKNNGNNNNKNGNGGNYQDAEFHWWSNYMIAGSSWLQNYAIKFQGCYDTLKWNDEAKDVDDVRLTNRHVVRFRLCPVNMCAPGYENGCSSDYGDYLIDLESYLQAYVEAKEAYDDWYDAVQQDQQQYQQNNKNDAYGYYYDENFKVENYLECTQSKIKMDENDYYGQAYNNYNYNNENNNNNNNNQNNGGRYYIGPYCSAQGGSIHMGLFKDDKCTIPADGEGGKLTYMEKTGTYLPFADRSIIEYDCFSCEEPNGQYSHYNQAGNDYYDEDLIADFCEVAYIKSGKCETNLPKSYFNLYKQKNNKACNYIEGIKTIRTDGSIMTTNMNSPGHLNSKAAGTFFAAFFGCVFLGLAYYVYHLKSKFARSDIVLD